MFADVRTRRLWPVFIEAICSIAWAYLAVGMIGFWALSYAVGLAPLGASPFPNFWGMVIATVALAQLGVGVWLEAHYNRPARRFYLWAPIYPLFYWLLMLIITVRATPGALLGRRPPGCKQQRLPRRVSNQSVRARPKIRVELVIGSRLRRKPQTSGRNPSLGYAG